MAIGARARDLKESAERRVAPLKKLDQARRKEVSRNIFEVEVLSPTSRLHPSHVTFPSITEGEDCHERKRVAVIAGTVRQQLTSAMARSCLPIPFDDQRRAAWADWSAIVLEA